ncbi:MAG: hypothetical protein WBG86_18725, partial [Polyangiales bacterium]
MRTQQDRQHLRRFLLALPMVIAACGSPDMGIAPDTVEGTAVTKGGLDGPAVAVGPFLNGALPSSTPDSIVDGDWRTTVAFPNLALGNIIAISPNPSDDRVYASTLEGLVVAFDDDVSVNSTQTFIDLRDRVARVFEGGLLGLVFHPEFGQPGSPHRDSFYAYYTTHCPLDSTRNASDLSACDDDYPRGSGVSGFFNVWLRLSKFEAFNGTVVGDPSSEQVLFNVRLFGSVHRGGGLGIRGNGELFVSIGDQFDRD